MSGWADEVVDELASGRPAEIADGRAGARARVRTGKLASGLKRHDDVAGERAVWE